MKEKILQIQLRLEKELAEIEASIPNELERFRTGTAVAEKNLGDLRLLVKDTTFSSKEDEIRFFRYEQPGILSKKIYYSQLFRIEAAGVPWIIQEDYRKFMNRHLQRIDMFFEDHRALYVYVGSGDTDKDEQYFLSNSQYGNGYPVDLDGMMDTRFCTAASFRLAEMMAYKEVSKYLLQKMDKLDGLQGSMSIRPGLRWTDSKTDLVELVYALYHAGSFNNGVAEVKQIFAWLEDSLGMDFEHGYSHFRDIRMRKKEIPLFLTRLKERLLKGIAELEEQN